MIIKVILLGIIGFCSGVVISGGVFAFIAIIGVVPRLAQKTGTQKYIYIYEDAIVIGGVFGVLNLVFRPNIPLGMVGLIIFGLLTGIFVGCIAVSLAEVLDVIPILTRRINLKRGMAFFLLALAIGKLVGSLIYFLVPGFAGYK